MRQWLVIWVVTVVVAWTYAEASVWDDDLLGALWKIEIGLGCVFIWWFDKHFFPNWLKRAPQVARRAAWPILVLLAIAAFALMINSGR